MPEHSTTTRECLHSDSGATPMAKWCKALWTDCLPFAQSQSSILEVWKKVASCIRICMFLQNNKEEHNAEHQEQFFFQSTQ